MAYFPGSSSARLGLVGANGQQVELLSLSELLTIGAGATTSSGIQIPANSIVIGVSTRVVVEIPVATSYSYGVASAATRYGTTISDAVGTTHPGLDDGLRFYAAATSLLVTPSGAPLSNTGRIRFTIQYFNITPATS